MMKTFKMAALAAATLLATGAAMAADPVNMAGLNGSSLAFVAMDNNGTPASLFVDLGYLFSNFAPGSAFYNAGNTITWNFATNQVSENGVARAGTFNYSSQLTAFMNIAQAGDVRWGVIAGDFGSPDKFLTTGLPTDTEIANMVLAGESGGGASAMGAVNALYNKQAGTGTFASPGFGAAGGPGTADSAVNQFGNFGPDGNWATSLAWNATVAQGTMNNFYFTENETLAVTKLAGQFGYDNGVLTFQTSPVPEPSAFMMAAAGLAVLGYAGRRRAPR